MIPAYGGVMVQTTIRPRCKCGSKKLQRIPRRPWMKLAPWTSLYLCRKCRREVFALRARHRRKGKMSQRTFLLYAIVPSVAFLWAALEYMLA